MVQESLNAIYPEYAWVVSWKTDYDAYKVAGFQQGKCKLTYTLTGPELHEHSRWSPDKFALELGRKIIDQGRIEDKGLAINRETQG